MTAATTPDRIEIPTAARVYADGMDANTLYYFKTYTVLPEVLPTRDRTAEVIAAQAAKMDLKSSVHAFQAAIGWLRLAYEVDTVVAVAILAEAMNVAQEQGKIRPSKASMWLGRLERAAAAFGLRYRW